MNIDIVSAGVQVAVLVLAVSVHEASHAWASDRLGDPGARLAGRMTLNPVKHIDPVGTVLVPLLLLAFGGPVFGWAKPVPVNPHRYRHRRLGMMLSALAGPGSNLGLAALLGAGLRVVGLAGALGAVVGGAGSWVGGPLEFAGYALGVGVVINVFLAVFNMIPVPPLDGSRVVPVLLPDALASKWEELERYGMLFFFALVFVVPSAFGGAFNPLAWVFTRIAEPLARFFLTWSVG